MRHFYKKRRRRITGNTVIHVPSTIGGTMATAAPALIVLTSPSIDAGESATTGIDDQDKDRTVQVGHHIGTFHINIAIRITTADGTVEFAVFKVERVATTPVIGTHPIPSGTTITNQGMQQATRLDNPGKVFHFSSRAYSSDNTINHKIVVSPAKFGLSKCKAGDYWILMMYNRGAATVTYDYQGRYKEYE